MRAHLKALKRFGDEPASNRFWLACQIPTYVLLIGLYFR